MQKRFSVFNPIDLLATIRNLAQLKMIEVKYSLPPGDINDYDQVMIVSSGQVTYSLKSTKKKKNISDYDDDDDSNNDSQSDSDMDSDDVDDSSNDDNDRDNDDDDDDSFDRIRWKKEKSSDSVYVSEVISWTVTEAGHFCPQLPIGLSHAYWIYRCINNGDAESRTVPLVLVQLISILEVLQNNQSFQYIPKQDFRNEESRDSYSDRVNAHKAQYYDRFMGKCDLGTLLNMYHAMEQECALTSISGSNNNNISKSKNRPDLHKQRRLYTQWAFDNSLNGKLLVQSMRKVEKLTTILRQLHIKAVSPAAKDSQHELAHIKGVFREIYPQNRFTVRKDERKKRPPSFIDHEGKTFFLHRSHLSSMTFRNGDVVYAVSRKFVKAIGKPIINFVSFVF